MDKVCCTGAALPRPKPLQSAPTKRHSVRLPDLTENHLQTPHRPCGDPSFRGSCATEKSEFRLWFLQRGQRAAMLFHLSRLLAVPRFPAGGIFRPNTQNPKPNTHSVPAYSQIPDLGVHDLILRIDLTVLRSGHLYRSVRTTPVRPNRIWQNICR